MHPSVRPLAEIYRLNTGLLRNCVRGYTEEDAQRRVEPRTNNVVFIALHLADARYHLAGWLGLELENPFSRFAQVRHIDEVREFPTLAAVMESWERVSTALEEHLPALGSENLQAPAPFQLPVGQGQLLDSLAFMAQHEAYHIGQLSLLRKQMGLDAMEWF